MPKRTGRVAAPALVALAVVGADLGPPAIATGLALAAVLAYCRATALATCVAITVVRADVGTTTVATLIAPAAVRALVALLLSLHSLITFEAGLEAPAEAVHLEAVLKEALLAAGAPDGLLLVAIVRHCLLVSVYPRVSLL